MWVGRTTVARRLVSTADRILVYVLMTAAVLLAAAAVSEPAAAQWRRGGGEVQIGGGEPSAPDFGFRFVRIQYQSTRSGGWGGSSWAYDYPTAEENLYEAIKRTANIHLQGDPIVLTLKSEEIFEHPILYLCEPGYWLTDEEEVENLKKYFERGGFMIIDDFHDYPGASPEWDNFYRNIKRVFPDREPVRLDASHPIWSIYYDIDPEEAASTKTNEGIGRYEDEYYAIFDDHGRMMVMICYNQDIGDGWEWPGRNLANASTTSFQMAINIIMYALTH